MESHARAMFYYFANYIGAEADVVLGELVEVVSRRRLLAPSTLIPVTIVNIAEANVATGTSLAIEPPALRALETNALVAHGHGQLAW